MGVGFSQFTWGLDAPADVDQAVAAAATSVVAVASPGQILRREERGDT